MRGTYTSVETCETIGFSRIKAYQWHRREDVLIKSASVYTVDVMQIDGGSATSTKIRPIKSSVKLTSCSASGRLMAPLLAQCCTVKPIHAPESQATIYLVGTDGTGRSRCGFSFYLKTQNHTHGFISALSVLILRFLREQFRANSDSNRVI